MATNEHDFTTLLKTMSFLGWSFERKPTSDELGLWSAMGRTTIPLIQYKTLHGRDVKLEAYLLRGRRSYAISRYVDTIRNEGEWASWFQYVKDE